VQLGAVEGEDRVESLLGHASPALSAVTYRPVAY
jgi:hypothetical protein